MKLIKYNLLNLPRIIVFLVFYSDKGLVYFLLLWRRYHKISRLRLMTIEKCKHSDSLKDLLVSVKVMCKDMKHSVCGSFTLTMRCRPSQNITSEIRTLRFSSECNVMTVSKHKLSDNCYDMGYVSF